MDEFLESISLVDTWDTLGWRKNTRTSTVLPNPASAVNDLKWQTPKMLKLPEQGMLDLESFKGQLQQVEVNLFKMSDATSTMEN